MHCLRALYCIAFHCSPSHRSITCMHHTAQCPCIRRNRRCHLATADILTKGSRWRHALIRLERTNTLSFASGPMRSHSHGSHRACTSFTTDSICPHDEQVSPPFTERSVPALESVRWCHEIERSPRGPPTNQNLPSLQTECQPRPPLRIWHFFVKEPTHSLQSLE
jgi:hypothetical protein